MIPLTNATRSRVTKSVFTVTFIIAILTVTAPQLLPCPARDEMLLANDRDKQKGRKEWDGKIVSIVKGVNEK